MTIEQKLQEDLKAAMRGQNKGRVNCIRQAKAKLQEAVNQPAFAGPIDDALWQAVIGRYSKSLQKAIGELKQAGGRSDALVASYSEEIAYLAQYLPQPAGETELTGWVQQAIAGLAIDDPRMAGRVVGAVLKAHPGCAEPGRLKALAEGLLTHRVQDVT